MKSLLKIILTFLFPDKFILLRTKKADSVALTFDDGPHPQNTKILLDTLRREKIKATFFVSGSEAEKYPELIKAIADDGHEIGNHSFYHRKLSEIGWNSYQQEVEKTWKFISKHLTQKLFRPPFGEINLKMVRFIANNQFIYVGWTVDSEDSFIKNSHALVQHFRHKIVKNGDIILFHEDYTSTIDSMPDIIADLKARGFKLVTISELIYKKQNKLI